MCQGWPPGAGSPTPVSLAGAGWWTSPEKTFEANGGGILAPGPFLSPPPGPGAKCDYVLIKYRRGATGGGLPHWEGGVAWLGASPPRAFPVGSRASTLG